MTWSSARFGSSGPGSPRRVTWMTVPQAEAPNAAAAMSAQPPVETAPLIIDATFFPICRNRQAQDVPALGYEVTGASQVRRPEHRSFSRGARKYSVGGTQDSMSRLIAKARQRSL